MLRKMVIGILAAVWTAPLMAGGYALPPQWWQMPGSPEGVPRHDDVHFIDERTGWSARADGTIYRTTDGGQTWNRMYELERTHFRAIGFSTPARGWAGNLGSGLPWGNIENRNPLYETFDGGETWSPVEGLAEAGVQGLCAVYVLDEDHIYAAGRVIGPAFFLHSNDGGENWTVQRMSHVEDATMNAIMDVYFHDPQHGFLVGMDTHPWARHCGEDYFGRIVRTTDGGQTWTPVLTTDIACSYFWKVTFPSPAVGYASLEQNGPHDDIVFYKTTDGGETWERHTISRSLIDGDDFYFQAIGFVNENEGWIGGASNTSSPANNFLHTTDGGLTWTPAGYDNSRQINRIRFLNPDFGIAAGSKLHVYRSPLAIDTHPDGGTVPAGTPVVLSLEVTGSPPFDFQWFRNGEPIDKASGPTFTLVNPAADDSGNYHATVANAFGELTSRAAALLVVEGPMFRMPEIMDDQRVRLVFVNSDGSPLTANDAERFQVIESADLREWREIHSNIIAREGALVVKVEIGDIPHRFFRIVQAALD